MINFICISPHPPIILPSVGSAKDRQQVKKTIESMESLGKKFKEIKPDKIIISAPHPDWGFNVPLYFLAKDFLPASGLSRRQWQAGKGEIETYLIGVESPKFYFEQGKELYNSKLKAQKLKLALIASGDMSHCLKQDGPYGFHPDGPKFDNDLIEALKNKDIEKILKLDDLYPEAGECGLRSFCFMLGILEASGVNWKAEILSYEGPFGVGYLVADFKINAKN
jgi:aromatic ring-opening dioxygenase LigB subunit